MHNLLKRVQLSARVPNINGFVASSQPATPDSIVIAPKMEQDIIHEDIDCRLVQLYRQKTSHQHGWHAGTQKDVNCAIGLAIHSGSQERNESNMQFLRQVEDLEQERLFREEACYEAAMIEVVDMGAGLHTPGSKQEDTVSSRLTQYSDPFRAVYHAPIDYSVSGDDTVSLSPLVSSSVLQKPEGVDVDDTTLQAKSGCTSTLATELCSIRLVPKVQSLASDDSSAHLAPPSSFPLTLGYCVTSQVTNTCDEFGRLYA